ncbi:MAG: undecaprenyl/decaprenyl-phosphate alpha-N-acetylglucosaminyl 1-phosphate transferase [Geodermatophilaceae bacterium]|nr:undecaprenyl/decaprenyl-phosphate alpha-N-acetylglucosaminyl 1-phosphate transferase [Geodermatophilaceae bacterium]
MREFAVVLLVSAIITHLLTPLLRAIAVSLRVMAQPRDRDVHAVPTPYLGGLALYGGILAGVGVATVLPALQRTFVYSQDILGVLAAGGLICLLGALDDRLNLDPLTKLVGQIACAGVMVLAGVQITSVYLPFGDLGTVLLGSDVAVPLTILLTVLTINAMNFIDGLDGLLAGVAAIAALAFFAYSYNLSLTFSDVASAPTLIAAVLAGSCLGFLPHNFQPARIFMGDSGSMLIGIMLAAAAVSATGKADPQTIGTAATFLPLTLPLLVPLAVLAFPLVDLVLAVLRRARGGRSPFAPDKLHLHHRLLEIGHSVRRAVLILYLWTAVLAFGAVAMSVAGQAPRLVLAVAAVLMVVVVVTTVPSDRGTRGGRRLDQHGSAEAPRRRP